jgi:hypothetical protein
MHNILVHADEQAYEAGGIVEQGPLSSTRHRNSEWRDFACASRWMELRKFDFVGAAHQLGIDEVGLSTIRKTLAYSSDPTSSTG